MPVFQWETISEDVIFESPHLRLLGHQLKDPHQNLRKSTYYIIDAEHWGHVIALTEKKELILVKQYRHAAKEITLEFPGGIIHKSEDPLQAIQRELREETGYLPARMEPLGVFYPNPALQTNKLFSFIAYDCSLQTSQCLDEDEHVDVVLMPLAAFQDLIQSNKSQWNHGLMLASVALAYPKLFSLKT